MARSKTLLRLAALATTAYLLTSCGWVREDIAYSNQQEWARFKETAWGDSLAQATGLAKLNPGPARREAVADADTCLHPAGRERITRQDGIEDSVAYRRCAVSPYATGGAAPGSRLSGR